MRLLQGINRQRYWNQPQGTETVVGIKVNDVPTEPKYVNKYVATVEFMFGDADGEGFSDIAFEADQPDMVIDFLQFCARCATAYLTGGAHREGYSHVEGYDKWCTLEDLDEADWDDIDEDDIQELDEQDPTRPYLQWRMDPMSDYEHYGTFSGVTVVWYDEFGRPYEVQIEVEA